MYFITELSVGGAQVALYNLLACLQGDTHQAVVACLYNGDKLIGQRISALGVPVYDLGMPNKLRLDAFWRLFNLLRQTRPDILYTWMFHANIPGRLVGRLAGVPHIISSEHTMGQEGGGRRWLNRLTAPLADRIVCVSQGIVDYAVEVIGLPKEKLALIPNGIDLEKYAALPSQAEARLRQHLPEEQIIVGAIGRPRPVKGYGILRQAFQQIAERRPNTHLVFVGDGPDKETLAAQAARSGLAQRVTWMGDQTDIPGLLPAFDILAVPSIYEGLGIVALEAMAAGLPVVGSRVGGIPEVVIEGETGLLVPAGDVSALAAALTRLVNDPDLRRRLGEAGSARVCERYSQQSVREKTLTMYSELLANG